MNTHLARGFTHNSNVFPVYLTSRKSRVVSLHVYVVVTPARPAGSPVTAVSEMRWSSGQALFKFLVATGRAGFFACHNTSFEFSS